MSDKKTRATGTVASQLRRQPLGLLALFLVLATGGAYAAVEPVGGKTRVDACSAKRGGDLRLRTGTKCRPGERRVSWARVASQGAQGPQGVAGPRGEIGPQGQAGPQGETGPQGATGPRGQAGAQGETGAQGDRGPSDAFEKRVFIFEEIGIDGIIDGQTVAELPLQPGAYVLSARADLELASATRNPGGTSCTLSAGNDSDEAETVLGTQAGQVRLASLSMSLVKSAATPITAQLGCTEEGVNPGALVNGARITAVRVATAHRG